MTTDRIEELLNETWAARQQTLAMEALNRAYLKVVDAIAEVPMASRGRPAGDAARLALSAAMFAAAVHQKVADSESILTNPTKTVNAALEVAFLAGSAFAAGRLAADKAKCGNRKPRAVDSLVAAAAATSLSAPAAARVLKASQGLSLAPLTLERRIRKARRATKP